MTTPRVHSLNVGTLRRIPRSRHETAIVKEPVESAQVRAPGPKHGGLGSGVVGDQIGSRKHHGGDTQAVYAVAREEIDWWSEHLQRVLQDGVFGENLTTAGLDVDAALLGERWRIGEVLLEVTACRVPCATFAARMGEPQWVRRFAERGRTGAYLGVVTPGTLHSGAPIEVVHRPAHGLTVPDHFRAVRGDHDLARRIVEARALWPAEHAWLVGRLAAVR